MALFQNYLKKTIRPWQNCFGFTLTEVVSVLGLTVMIMVLIYNVFLISQKSFIKGDEKMEITQNARILLDRLSRELRQTQEITTALPSDKDQVGFPPAAEIMFQDGHDEQNIQYLRYYAIGALIKRQKIVYFFSAEPDNYVKWNALDQFGQPPNQSVIDEKDIAEYVSQMQFYGDNLINIDLSLIKNQSTSRFFTSIWGRNIGN
ncbi:MAG: hypothetical protein WCV73_04790 [Patescibacteria group bacterium]|jgi:hypothetical protein